MKKELTSESESVVIPDPKAEVSVAEPEMDKVVDEITKHDSDELLEAEDAKHIPETPKRPWYKKLFNNKKVAIPTAIVVVLAIISLVPQTRYPLFGLFLKDNYALTVRDSQTNQPISAAMISVTGKTVITDNHGVAHLKVKVGQHTVTITKKYYANFRLTVLVPLRSHAGTTVFELHATGRQVPLTITNKIDGKPIDNVMVKAADTEARTDKQGHVIIVLPVNKSNLPATITASGYNSISVTVQVTAQAVAANTFTLTPAGKIYFLSKLSGKIDVVKTNLDGTDRETVLAGTGNEDDQNTVLLASRDWKYLVLLSKRDTTGHAQLNLIDTSNDQLTNIDKGDVGFTLVGWQGHYFIYDVSRNAIPASQSNREALKSFNADTSKIIVLDQNSAVSNNGEWAYNQFENFYLLNDNVFYIAGWVGTISLFQGQHNLIRTVRADGQSHTDVKAFDATQTSNYFLVTLAKPNELYIRVSDNNDTGETFYDYSNGSLTTAANTVTDSAFNLASTTYLLSPAGTQTFWSESRDGKNTLFIGDADGANSKQIATLSDYDTYGWYTDTYVLVSKGSDELYIMSIAGGNALKITDYHKPVLNYSGYGGGYGGK